MTGSIHSGLPYRSLLIDVLADVDQKPRTRGEWEQRFAVWRQPASQTEEEKIESAKRRVTRALEKSEFLRNHKWEIVSQGSYHNNTNVRNDSDVDLCIRLTDTFQFDGPPGDAPTLQELGYLPLTFTYADFRRDIVRCLSDEYPFSVVDGNKAIHINKDQQERVSIDVVPVFTYQKFGANGPLGRGVPDIGVAFWANAARDRLVTSFPEQHHSRGSAKNFLTGRRFKRVVRILKRMRNHIEENTGLSPQTRMAAKSCTSHLIECLVYNCPNPIFNQASIYDDVVGALHFLSEKYSAQRRGLSLLGFLDRDFWMEVNGIMFLHRPDQAWTEADAAAFIQAAVSYMEI